MRNILLVAVLIIALVFVAVQTGFAEEGYFNTDGVVFSDQQIRQNIYAEGDKKEEPVETIEVTANDKIYVKGSTRYVGDRAKKKFDTGLPMYIKDGQGIKFLPSGQGKLIATDFSQWDSYEDMIIEGGIAYNDDFSRADWNTYMLVRLQSGLYINTGEMTIGTFVKDRIIPENSICYFTENEIRYYYYEDGKFYNEVIDDVDMKSTVSINGLECSYYDFMLGIGEIELLGQHNGWKPEGDGDLEYEDTEGDLHGKDHENMDGQEGSSGSSDDGEDDKDGNPLSPKDPQKPEAAAKPKDVEAVAPNVPVPKPSAPAPPAAAPPLGEDENWDIVYPDWKMPEVTHISITPGIYTLSAELKVSDPAGVIVGGVTYEIVRNEEDTKGKLYKRTAVTVPDDSNNGQFTALISGLIPEYKFVVRGYFKYRDKFGRVVDETVEFLPGTEVTTKPLTDLGPIKLQDFGLERNDKYFSDQVILPNVRFDNSSDKDAVGSLVRMVVAFTKDGEQEYATTTLLSDVQLEQARSMLPQTLSSDRSLEPSTKYNFRIFCYDRFGNELPVEGDTGTTRTCKQIPKTKIKIVSGAAGKINATVTMDNVRDFNYENLKIVVRDNMGKAMNIGPAGEDYLAIERGTEYEITGLALNKSYTAYVICDADIDDGKGVKTQTMTTQPFTTSPLDALGKLFIDARNVTDSEPYNETSEPWKQAIITVAFNENFTDPELIPLVSQMSVSFQCDGEDVTYSFTDEELNKLKNGTAEDPSDKTILIDTNDIFGAAGMKSDTKYKVKFSATYIYMPDTDEEEKFTIKTQSGMSTIQTQKRPVEVKITNVQAYKGFLMADIKIEDLDDVIVGNSVLLQVREMKGTASSTMIGGFAIEKNKTETYKLRMFSDGEQSSDGNAYDIKGETEYLLRFIAEEANVGGGIASNHVVFEDSVTTGVGVDGRIYLKSLDPVTGDSAHYNAKVLMEVQDPDQWLASKTCMVDVYINRGGQSQLVETKAIKYTGIGTGSTPIEFTCLTEANQNQNVRYELRMYVDMAPEGSGETIRVPLSSVTFTTEKRIYTISNYSQLLTALQGSSNKYVVIKDIYHTDNASNGNANMQTNYNKGMLAGKTSNCQIDFQGFTFGLSTRRTFINALSSRGKITNLVLDWHEWANNNNDVCFIYHNYGTLSNIKVTYSQDSVMRNPETSDKNGWGIRYDEVTGERLDWEYPKYNTPLVSHNNSGAVIENFVVQLETPMVGAYQTSIVARDNKAGAIVRNGYVYGPEENDYKARMELKNSFYDGNVEKNGFRTGVVGINSGTVENVFALMDVDIQTDYDTGLTTTIQSGTLVGLNNSGTVKNSYAIGDVVRNGKIRKQSGPAVDNNYGTATNVFYVADNAYENTHNRPSSVVALRSAIWQNSILNGNERNVKGFNVDSLIQAGCYPQVSYTSDLMPTQDYIPLPLLAQGSNRVDVVLSSELEASDPLYDTYKAEITGDEAWDKADENGRKSDSRVVVIYVTDRAARQVDSVEISGLSTEVLGTVLDGSGVSTVYVKVSEATACKDTYSIDAVTFKNHDLMSTDRVAITDRTVDVKFYWRIYNESGNVDHWRKMYSKPKENFRLMNDLDFEGKTLKDFIIHTSFEGELDGGGYTVRNMRDSESFVTRIGDTYVGIFSRCVGSKMYDLTFENIHLTGGKGNEASAGIVAGDAITDAEFSRVYVKDSSITSNAMVGGFVGWTNSSCYFYECGVSNVKIVNSGGANGDHCLAGGFIASATGGGERVFERCYVQNVYIESMGTKRNSAVGGLIAYAQGTGYRVTGCYVTGHINASAQYVGGLIGCRNEDQQCISNVYTDVDIVTYNGVAGGITGVAQTNGTPGAESAVVFGNITTGNRLESGDDRISTIAPLYYHTESKGSQTGMVYEGARFTVDVGGGLWDASGNNGADYETFSFEDYQYASVIEYLGPEYFYYDFEGFFNGVLPKLVGNDGYLLPYQQDEYLGTEGGEITASVESTETTMKVTLNHGPDITIKQLYTDYRYVDEFLNIPLEESNGFAFYGYDCFTRHQALKYTMTTQHGSGKTVFNCSNLQPASYYDNYRVTAVIYEKTLADGTTQQGVLRVNIPLNVDMQFAEVYNIQDWRTKVGSSYCENFRLMGDIDFVNETLVHSAQGNSANRTINRLVGANQSSYYKVKNAKMVDEKMAAIKHEGGYSFLYYCQVGLIRNIVTECAYVNFDNINVMRNTKHTGIISGLTGDMHHVSFTNCNVKGGYGQGGCISISRGMMKNVSFKNCTIGMQGTASHAGMVGIQLGLNKHEGASDITIDNCNVNTTGTYVGLFAGELYIAWYNQVITSTTISKVNVTNSKAISTANEVAGITNISRGMRATIKDCTIKDSQIQGKQHVGGITVGIYDTNGGTVIVENCEARNITVHGTSNDVGGIVGYFKDGKQKIRNCRIYDSKITTDSSTVGGIAGYLPAGTVENGYVENCEIIAKKDYAGGIAGGGSVWYSNDSKCTVRNSVIVAKLKYAGGIAGQTLSDVGIGTMAAISAKGTETFYSAWIDNCAIYSGDYAGGAYGINNNHKTNGTQNTIVTNCDIRANAYVGGIVGKSNRIIKDNYVYKTVIGALTSDVRSKYGLAAKSIDAEYCYGGIAGIYYGPNIQYSMVEECIIGDPGKANCGGIYGKLLSDGGGQANVVKNCVVVGHSATGGLAGSFQYGSNTNEGKTIDVIDNCYSNALVKANTAVGGIFGTFYERSWETTTTQTVNGVVQTVTTTHRSALPSTYNLYFTGTLEATTGAAGLYSGGMAGAGADLMRMQAVVLMPGYVKAKSINNNLLTGSSTASLDKLTTKTGSTNMNIVTYSAPLTLNGTATTVAEKIPSEYTTTDRNLYGKRKAGDPFIFIFDNYVGESAKTSDIIKLTGTNCFKDMSIAHLMPVTKPNNSDNAIFSPATASYNYRKMNLPQADINEGETPKRILMKQGVYIPGTTGYQAELELKQKMYDDYFGPSATDTTRTGFFLEKEDGAAVMMTMSMRERQVDMSQAITMYSSGVDTFNMDFAQDFFDMFGTDVTMKLFSLSEDGSSETVWAETTVDKRSFTFKYDYMTVVGATLTYTDDTGRVRSQTINITPAQLVNTAMLYDGEGYYIEGGSLYRASDASLLSEGSWIHLQAGKALDTEGKIVNISDLSDAGNAAAGLSLTSTGPLYTFSYSGKELNTYGTYTSVVDAGGEAISDEHKLYVKNGELISISTTLNPVSDGIFAYSDGDGSIILTLDVEGRLNSLGSVNVLERFRNFTNRNFRAMTSNMNSGGTLVILSRTDGSMSGYDVKTGEELFRTAATQAQSFGEFVGEYAAMLFGVGRYDVSGDSQTTEEIIDLMESSNMSLDQVVSQSQTMGVDALSTMAADTQNNEGSDGENTDETTGGNEGENTDETTGENAGEVTDETTGGNEGEVTGGNTGDSTESITQTGTAAAPQGSSVLSGQYDWSGSGAVQHNSSCYAATQGSQALEGFHAASSGQQYVAVYEKDTQQFEIYTVEALLETPEKAVAETEKIVDKSALKAMYRALAEGTDDTDKQGMALYGVILLMIFLIGGVVIGIITHKGKENSREV